MTEYFTMGAVWGLYGHKVRMRGLTHTLGLGLELSAYMSPFFL